jgi:hypothetical protein
MARIWIIAADDAVCGADADVERRLGRIVPD